MAFRLVDAGSDDVAGSVHSGGRPPGCSTAGTLKCQVRGIEPRGAAPDGGRRTRRCRDARTGVAAAGAGHRNSCQRLGPWAHRSPGCAGVPEELT